MATFQAQVEGITQLSVGATPTTGELTQFLIDGVKEVVNRIIAIRPDEIGKFTLSTHDAADAGTILTGRVLSVVREHDDAGILRECSLISPGDRYAASDSTSLMYRSKYNPGFYILDGKLHTVPAAAAGDNDSIVTQVSYCQPAFDDVSLDNFPDEYEYLVALYASFMTVHAVMGGNIISITAVPPDTPDPPNIDNSAVDNSGVEIGSLGSVPDYNQTATAPVIFRTYFDAQFGDSDPLGFTLNAVAPDSPTLTAITYSGAGSTLDANAGGFTTAVAGPSSTFATQSFNAFYGASGLSNIGDHDPGPLALNAVAPDAITTAAQSVSFGTAAPVYDAPTYNPTDIAITEYDSFTDGLTVTQPTSFTLSPVPPDTPDVPELSSVGTAPAYNDSVANTPLGLLAGKIANASTFTTTNEDVELAASKLSEVQAIINEANILMQNELNDFNEENVVFQATIQKEVQEDTLTLQKYQADLTSYQAEVNAEVQEYQQQLAEYQLELGNQIQIWNTRQSLKVQQYQAELGEYNAQLQNSLQEFNEDNALYQAQLQVSMQNVQMEDVQQARLLQKYGADLQTYQAEINAEVQEHTQKHAKYQLEFSTTYTAWAQEYQAAVQESMQELQIANQINIQKAQAEVGDQDRELQRQLQEGVNNMQQKMNDNARQISLYQTDAQVYQAEVAAEIQEYDKKIARYTQELGVALQAWQNTESNKMQDALNEWNEEHATYQVNLQKEIHNSQVASAKALRDADLDLQAKIQDYTLELQKYQADVATYQAEVATQAQEQGTKIQQYQVLYNQIKQQYDEAFTIGAKPAQEQQQEA